MNLRIDPERRDLPGETGIFVRAQSQDGSWTSADILQLTRESLIEWLASRDAHGSDVGGAWRDSVVLTLLGYN